MVNVLTVPARLRWPMSLVPEMLTPVRYHGYTSAVKDAFISVNVAKEEDKEQYASFIKVFNDIKKRCQETFLNVEGKWQKGVWDNKIVIECKTKAGNTVYIGFYDCVYSMGLGVGSGQWVKPKDYLVGELS